jgi:hypothetical protein
LGAKLEAVGNAMCSIGLECASDVNCISGEQFSYHVEHHGNVVNANIRETEDIEMPRRYLPEAQCIIIPTADAFFSDLSASVLSGTDYGAKEREERE